MSLRVVFHRLAAKEVRDAEHWYFTRSPEAAASFRGAVLTAAEQIASSVKTHPIEGTRFRYVRVARFPHRLVYVLDSPSLATVLAVAHDRRRPGYWLRRR